MASSEPDLKDHYNGCVLVTRFSALGDVCMTIPVVYGACLANPSLHFVMLTKPAAAGLFLNTPRNLTVITADLKNEYGGALGAVKLLDRLRKDYGVTMMADLHNVLRTRIMGIAALARGIKVARLDKCRPQRRKLIKCGAMHAPALQPVMQRYAEVFARLGLTTPAEYPAGRTPIGMPDEALFAKVSAPKSAGAKWVAVAPFAAHQAKVYPPELMREVVRRIAAESGVTVFLFGGGKSETAILSEWADSIEGHVVCVAGSGIGFAGELALLSRMDAALTMDSANMHLASIAGAPVVSVWGATHPSAGFYGWRQKPDMAVQTQLECRPCSVFGNKACHRGDFACMKRIKPEEITDKVLNTIYESGH